VLLPVIAPVTPNVPPIVALLVTARPVPADEAVTNPLKVGLATTAMVTVSVAPTVDVRLEPAAIVIVSPLARASGVPELAASVRPVKPPQEDHVGALPVVATRHCPVVPAAVEPIALVPLPYSIPFVVNVPAPVPPLATVRLPPVKKVDASALVTLLSTPVLDSLVVPPVCRLLAMFTSPPLVTVNLTVLVVSKLSAVASLLPITSGPF
jgi:hypothetical protein